MSVQTDNTMGKNGQSDSPKFNPQQNTSDYKNQTGRDSDKAKLASEGSPPKFDKQNQPQEFKDKDKKDIDYQRHPEEQIVRPSEFTKKDTKNSPEESKRV